MAGAGAAEQGVDPGARGRVCAGVGLAGQGQACAAADWRVAGSVGPGRRATASDSSVEPPFCKKAPGLAGTGQPVGTRGSAGQRV